jgi:hypothetical protein
VIQEMAESETEITCDEWRDVKYLRSDAGYQILGLEGC